MGCDSADLLRLTPAERAHCHERFGAEARKQPPFSGADPLKRAGYAAEAERINKCRHYDTPVAMARGVDRNEARDFDPRRPESQRGESSAVTPPGFDPFHSPCS